MSEQGRPEWAEDWMDDQDIEKESERRARAEYRAVHAERRRAIRAERRWEAEERRAERRRQDMREPRWTTGQGIGFLVAAPGLVAFGVTVVLGMIYSRTNHQVSDEEAASLIVLMLGGFVWGIMGWIVFHKCGRRR